MRSAGWRRAWLWTIGLGGLLILAGAGLVICDEKTEEPKLLFPPDQAVLSSGNFDVICKATDLPLEVDGQKTAWESFTPPVRVAHVGLEAGLHTIAIGPRRVQFSVALNGDEHEGPKEWPHYRRHPLGSDEDRCVMCHETRRQGGQIVLGALKSYRACLDCHEQSEFDVAHSHPLQPLEPCQMCHALHGSKEKALLRAPAKQLCTKCHDS
jgi:predicted CXXCH cytochrome family protein